MTDASTGDAPPMESAATAIDRAMHEAHRVPGCPGCAPRKVCCGGCGEDLKDDADARRHWEFDCPRIEREPRCQLCGEDSLDKLYVLNLDEGTPAFDETGALMSPACSKCLRDAVDEVLAGGGETDEGHPWPVESVVVRRFTRDL